jgi:hypothetical protein
MSAVCLFLRIVTVSHLEMSTEMSTEQQADIKYNVLLHNSQRHYECFKKHMVRQPILGGVPVTTAWHALGLRMEERPQAIVVSCEYIE